MAGLWDVLSGIGYALDTPGALTRAGIANLADLVTGQDRHQGWRASGRDLAYSLGLVGENQPGLDAGDVLGLGLDIAVDPLNLIGGGMVAKLFGKASKAAKTNAASKVLREAGWMPEELAKTTKINTALLHPPEAWMNPEQAAAHVAEYSKNLQPARLYHGTAAPVFEEFAEDIGTGNWMGKGSYFTTDPKATSYYASMIKERPDKIVDSPVRIAYDLRKIDDLNARIKRIPEELRVREEKLADAEGWLSRLKSGDAGPSDPLEFEEALHKLEREVLFRKHEISSLRDSSHRWNREIAALEAASPRTMMRYGYSEKPFVFEEPATLGDIRAIAKASPYRSLYFDRLRDVREMTPIQKGHAFLASPADQDLLSPILQKQGYDALHHGEDFGAHDIEINLGGWEDEPVTMLETWGNPGLDAHPETVIFNPKNIYQPFIAPALQKVRRWPAHSLAGALMGQEALTGMTQ